LGVGTREKNNRLFSTPLEGDAINCNLQNVIWLPVRRKGWRERERIHKHI
jgi:hypothetical protein